MHLKLIKQLSTIAILLILPIGLYCGSKKENSKMSQMANSKTIRFVALGDSYTIGEGTSPDEAWPSLLTNNLKNAGLDINLIANPSRTGWTTTDLINRELDIYDNSQPNFATLLIGVNDWVQGVDSGTFHKNLVIIINRMQAKLQDKSNLILITIPDFSVTPTGAQYGYGRDISKGLSQFNDIIKSEAAKRKLPVVDIFPISKNMGKDPSLVAKDGLHPSAKEYAIWEQLIYPIALTMLKK